MLFEEVLIASVVLLAFFMPVVSIGSFVLGAEIYRKGVNAVRAVEKGGKAEQVTPKIAKKSQKMDAKAEKYEAISRNIDIYDGTPIGQEKIYG